MPHLSLTIAAVASLAVSVTAQSELATDASTEIDYFTTERAGRRATSRKLAAAELNKALDQRRATCEGLAAGAQRAAAQLSPGSLMAEHLRGFHSHIDDVNDLERTIERAVSDLTFEPLIEAPLPVGWPPTAPVKEVVIKRYPKYRMATTPMRKGAEMTPFWRLFNHIKNNDIAMTAPVQMGRSADGQPEEQMAFLYRDEATGPLEARGEVKVIDVESSLAISTGARGFRGPAGIEEMTSRLERWLERNLDHFERAGPVRVMGYNSPMVPLNRRFFEVEIPIRRRTEAIATAAQTPQIPEHVVDA